MFDSLVVVSGLQICIAKSHDFEGPWKEMMIFACKVASPRREVLGVSCIDFGFICCSFGTANWHRQIARSQGRVDIMLDGCCTSLHRQVARFNGRFALVFDAPCDLLCNATWITKHWGCKVALPNRKILRAIWSLFDASVLLHLEHHSAHSALSREICPVHLFLICYRTGKA